MNFKLGNITLTLKDVYKNKNTYEKWENENRQKNQQKKYLVENSLINKTRENQIKNKANIIMRAVEISDNYSENYAEDIEMATEMAVNFLNVGITSLCGSIAMSGIAINANKMQKNQIKSLPIKSMIIPTISSLLVLGLSFLIIPWATKKQVEASRVGRFKAREKELKDVRNFVEYTPEQINEAKNVPNISGKDPEKKDDNSQNLKIRETFKTISKLDDEYKNYKEYYDKNEGLSENIKKKEKMEFSESELKKANSDKELILNITKHINNRAEEYSENIENAFATVKSLSFLACIPTTAILTKIMNKLFTKMGNASNTIISGFISIIFAAIVVQKGTKGQKESARVGRFKAKQEIKENLSNFVYFSDEELKSAKIEDVKEKKQGFFKKIWSNLNFLKTYQKDRNEYLEYKNVKQKEQTELYKNLKTVNVSDKQLEDAKNLQEKTFFAFDELDEMSQSYSENIEAACELGKNIIGLFPTILGLTLPIIPILKFKNGKLNFAKIIKNFVNLSFDENSVIRKSINKIYAQTQNDLTLRSAINEVFHKEKTTKSIQTIMTNKEISEPLNELIIKISSIIPKTKNENKTLREILSAELKQNKIAKFAQNLFFDLMDYLPTIMKKNITQLKKNPDLYNNPLVKNLINKSENIPKSKMGNTLKNTILIVILPVLALMFGVTFMVESWFTNLQKKAGKIGVMKAIKNMDKTQYFTDKKLEKTENETAKK